MHCNCMLFQVVGTEICSESFFDKKLEIVSDIFGLLIELICSNTINLPLSGLDTESSSDKTITSASCQNRWSHWTRG